MAKKAPTIWLDGKLTVLSNYFGLVTTKHMFYKELTALGLSTTDQERYDWDTISGITIGMWGRKPENTNNRLTLVAVNPERHPTPTEIMGTLIHESVHVWQRHCETIGDEKPSDETEAYSIQSIAMTMMAAYDKQRPWREAEKKKSKK